MARDEGEQGESLHHSMIRNGARVAPHRGMQAATVNEEEQRAPAPTRGVREQIGDAVGKWMAPIVGTIAKWRHARMFHPVGQTYAAQFEAAAPWAERLGRSVIVRTSGALSKAQRERFEVLGIALRFHRGHKLSTKVVETDQDLLFATIASPFTMALSPFTTNAHDFLANRFYAVSPFQIDDARYELRMTPQVHAVTEGTRAERFLAAVESGEAVFALEARKTLTWKWQTVGTLRVEKPLDLDQEALRFDPYNDGAGLQPVGVVHAMRRATYAISRKVGK